MCAGWEWHLRGVRHLKNVYEINKDQPRLTKINSQVIQKKYFVCDKPHGQNESYPGDQKIIFFWQLIKLVHPSSLPHPGSNISPACAPVSLGRNLGTSRQTAPPASTPVKNKPAGKPRWKKFISGDPRSKVQHPRSFSKICKNIICIVPRWKKADPGFF